MLRKKPLRPIASRASRPQLIVRMVVSRGVRAWMFPSEVVPLGLARGILGRDGVSAVPRGEVILTSRPSGKIEFLPFSC